MNPSELSEKQITPLEEINRAAFSCGVEPLDEYFTTDHILDDLKRGLASAYIFVHDPTGEVVGYYTLSNFQVIREELSGSLAKKMKYGLVPATLIGRLAITQRLQGQGIWGSVTLTRALIRAYRHGQEIASRVAVVDTISDRARRFYVRNGFSKLSNEREQYFFDLRRVPEMAKKLGLLV